MPNRKNTKRAQYNQDVEKTCSDEDELERKISKFTFHPFEKKQVSWQNYINHFERLAKLKGFGGNQYGEVRKDLLLAYVGTTPLAAIQNYVFPRQLDDISYDEVLAGFNKIFMPSMTIFACRIEFEKAHRLSDETFTTFSNRLKELSIHCRYGVSLDERLRDKFIGGVRHAKVEAEVRQKWPEGVDSKGNVVSFNTILELAVIMENAETETGKELPSCSLEKVNVRRNIRVSKCSKCGFEEHKGNSCPAKNSFCRRCSKKGHYARCCDEKKGRAVKCLETESSEDDESKSDSVHIQSICGRAPRATIDVRLNGILCRMEYDSGARVSTINRDWWEKLSCPKLKEYKGSLMGYGRKNLKTLGTVKLNVQLRSKKLILPVVVMEEDDVPLFGLPWSLAFGLALPEPVEIRKLNNKGNKIINDKDKGCSEIQELVKEYSDIFKNELGTIRGTKANIHLQESAVPKAFKARRVPFPLRKPVEHELNRLEKEGIIEKIDPSLTPIVWATPTVNIDKGDGSVRICGDFRVTLNPVLLTESHLMPTFDELVSKLVGSSQWTVIDLRDAYLQMKVSEESKKFLTIVTHTGYYRYNRMCFGLSSAPAKFQRYMDELLRDLPCVSVLLDDVVIGGKNKEEHLRILREVFSRLRADGLRVKLDKCQFMKSSVRYLGHQIDKDGVHPTVEKVEAIKSVPTPKNVKELRAFLGMVNFYEKFIPHLHAVCTDLHRLTGSKVRWHWSEREEQVFQNVKNLLSTSDTIVPYDMKLPIILRCDASEAGLGAVLLHRMDDGSERPVAFASRVLSRAEKHYSSIDREALALVFGVKKFHQFLFGTKFTLVTDHRPLIRIFGSNRDLPKVTNNRLVRWAILLMSYDYKIEYCTGRENVLADALSRLPENLQQSSEEAEEETYLKCCRKEKIDTLSDQGELKRKTDQDTVLRKIKRFITNGWPKTVEENFKTFWKNRDELSVEEGVVMRLGRFVPPSSLRLTVMRTLHSGHPGIEGMRSLARYYTWWPGMDEDLERYVKGCRSCQEGRDKEPEVPLYPWNLPDAPWDRLHLDLAGPFDGHQWLVGVDGLTKWPEVEMLKKITSEIIIRRLRSWFSRFGIPKQLVTDNGPQFTSAEFRTFCKKNGIRHITSSPYHPKTNGLVERFIRTFKRRYLACKGDVRDPLLALQRFLFSYRNTPHKTTGRAPAELFLGKRLPTILDRVQPNFRDGTEQRIWRQKENHDRKSRPREFEAGEEVWVQQDRKKGWEPGLIMRRTSDLSYEVLVGDQKKRKHADQLRRREGAIEDLPQAQSSGKEEV